MKKSKYLITGLIFLILSGVIIYSTKLTVVFFPTQEMELRGELEYGALKNEVIIIQEITSTKEYLSAVELAMLSWGMPYLNENTLMVLDANHKVLYKHSFTNENMVKLKYQIFKFPEKIHVGKGQKVIVCLSTSTGDKDSHLAIAWTPKGKLGKLSVKPLVDGNVVGALKRTDQEFIFDGSLCVRTYESNFGYVNWFKIILFSLALLVALLIIFAKKIEPLIVKLTIAPEKCYVVLALVFGLSLVFLTPPLQTPDEQDHLNRAYQLAELNIFQYDSTVPASLIKLFDTFGRLNFNPLQKTNVNEILSQREVELNPQVRSAIFARSFIFPYFPQALGMFIGKMFNSSPVMLLYMGRVFNLLFAIAVIFFAIRTAPFFKWFFFLLALMPMTLYLCASLSKDAMIISLSFLLIAMFLQFAYDHQKKISTKDFAVLFTVSFLLATSRSVYAILIGMFFLIPVYRIGSFKKYVVIFMSLIITVFLATQIGALKPLFQPKTAVLTQTTINLSLPSATLSTPAQTKTPIERFDRPDRIKFPEGVNYTEQKSFILHNPIQYLGILINSLFISNNTDHLNSFIGKLGWLNKPLPKWHINFYLLILIITALLFSSAEIRIGLINKFIMAAIFIAGVVFNETGLYLTWNPVGQDYIQDVQGRYYIPYAPLFFLLLYNNSLWQYLKKIFAPREKKHGKIKQKGLIKANATIQNNHQIALHNSCYLLIVCFSVVSLLSTVYVVLTGYYIVLV